MKLVDICFESQVVRFHCETCNGKGSVGALGCDPDWCSSCAGDGVVVVYLGTLLANLSIAGALCAAFDCGSVYASRLMSRVPFRREPWEPNIEGRPAPVWRPNVDGKAAPIGGGV